MVVEENGFLGSRWEFGEILGFIRKTDAVAVCTPRLFIESAAQEISDRILVGFHLSEWIKLDRLAILQPFLGGTVEIDDAAFDLQHEQIPIWKQD